MDPGLSHIDFHTFQFDKADIAEKYFCFLFFLKLEADKYAPKFTNKNLLT